MEAVIDETLWKSMKLSFYETLVELYKMKATKESKSDSFICCFPGNLSESDLYFINRKNYFDTVFLCCLKNGKYLVSFSIKFIEVLEKSLKN